MIQDGEHMKESLTWRIFGSVNEFLKKGYSEKPMDNIAKLFAQELGAEDVALFIYEEQKKRFRLIGTSDEKLEEAVGSLKISEEAVDVECEPYKPIKYDCGRFDPNLKGYTYLMKLAYKDEMLGLIFIKGMEEPDIPKLAATSLDLSMALRFLFRYKQMDDSLKKYTLLGRFTELFEKSREMEELLEGFMVISLEVLEAEGGFIAEKNGNSYRVVAFKDLKLKSDEIPIHHPLVVELEHKKSLLLTRSRISKLAIDEIIDGDLKSLIASTYEIDDSKKGFIVLVNKKDKPGYRPYKHFDDVDLSVLNEISKRFSLASSRLGYLHGIRSEIEKLENLRKKHEDLIKVLREHIRKLNSVYVISQAMRSSYNLTNVYKILLLGIISPRGLNFDRAMLFIKDNKQQLLIGKFWAGFENEEEFKKYQKKAAQRALRYGDIVQYLREEALTVDFTKGLTNRIEGKILHYKGHPVLERVVMRKRVYHVTPNLVKKTMGNIYDLVELVGTDDFVIMPLVGRWDTIGIVILDNKLTKRPIVDMDVEILKLVAESAGLAIENVINYEELKNKTISLERQKDLIDYLRRFSESILHNLDISVVVVDEGGKVLEWNRKAEQIFGRPRERMIGTHISWLSPEFEDIWAVAGRVFDTHETFYLSNYLLNINGEEKYFDIKFSPLWNFDSSKIEGVIITFEDVTVRYQLELERKRQEKLAALGEMAARVAHELRNPISVIGGFLRRLKKHADNPELRSRYMEILEGEIERLEGIVNEILEFSRDVRKLNFIEFNIVELIREVFLLHEEKLESKGVEFEIISDKDEIVVLADRSRIKQVLINLVQNAIDAVPDKDGKIRISIEDEGERVRVEVWNNGDPIPPDIKEKIFTPFFTTKVHGTGLGLPISKKIIEDEHNGKIWVESSPDRGTSFIFVIPKEKGE